MSDYPRDPDAVMRAQMASMPLFSPPARRTDPPTSKAAGRKAAQFKGDHERRILEALAAGPGTKDELAHRCGLSEQQVARRMAGLKRRGLVVDTGERRASTSGCAERVWRVAS